MTPLPKMHYKDKITKTKQKMRSYKENTVMTENKDLSKKIWLRISATKSL